MADIYKIAQSWMGVWVHSGPGVGYPHVGVIYGKDNKEYTVSERKNTYWLKIGEGRWCCDRDSNGMIVMTKTRTEAATPVKPEPEKEMQQIDEETLSYVPNTKPITLSEQEFETALEDNFTISNLRGIFGMPYQFMESADPRVSPRSDIGRKYAKEVVANMPLLLMTAGKPVFMGGYNDEDKGKILELFTGMAAGLDDKIKDAVLSNDFGKYYTLEYAFEEYFEYVNPMCRVAARYMNLHDVKLDGTKLDNYSWYNKANSNFTKLFSVYAGCTAWYCQSETQITDTFSNETSQSMIADKINSLSDYGRELNFLLGTVKAETGYALDQFTSMENLDKNIITQFADEVGKFGKVGGIFKSLTNSIQTVVAGGKLVFPELWSGSSFGRSYDVSLKLVSPDGDDLSIYLNIIVPIIHLLAFVLPREGLKSHGYISPFLVRAFYKGLFNVDMGIITDLTITKGKEAAWTPSGVPTTVDVSFTIKDLYNDMYMSTTGKILNNIMLMDYIGNMCGININEVDIMRGIDLYLTQNIQNKITDTWHLKIFGKLNQWVTNKWQGIFGKF